MILKSAFNALARLHSRPVLLKRLGTVDIYSPARITPSSYSRFFSGPESTQVSGIEFIIPLDTLVGQYAQKIMFNNVPSTGQFKVKYGANETALLDFNVAAMDLQIAMRTLAGLSNVLVTGSFLLGFTITFAGLSVDPDLLLLTNDTLDATPTISKTNVKWTEQGPKRGDRIVDGTKIMSIQEVIEMYDLGAVLMAYRVRVD